MSTSPDNLTKLAEDFAEFIRRARRAPISSRDRERLIAYVKKHADLIAPAPRPVVQNRPAEREDPWRDIGYGPR